MLATQGNNEQMSPEQLAERMGISLQMVPELDYTPAWPHLRITQRTVRFTEGPERRLRASAPTLRTGLQVKCRSGEKR